MQILLRAYERGLDIVLRFRFTTLCVFFATLALSVYLFVIIPKGFFPQQDIGLLTGISEAGQDASPGAMMRHQQALGEIVLKDPAVEHVGMFIGGSGNAPSNGRMFITLKPRDDRTENADQIIARLRAQLTPRPARWRRWRASSPTIRRRWPLVRILVRADSGFAREELMAWCEANGVHFLFGLAKPAHRRNQDRA